MGGDGLEEMEEEMMNDIVDGCSTPKRWECQIHTPLVPPPPKKKNPFSFGGRKREAPKHGYFYPPHIDLEQLFTLFLPSNRI